VSGYRQQLRRARLELRREQGLALLNRKLQAQMNGRLVEHLAAGGAAVPVTDEASTPGN
jgi:hypothetical protein